MNNIKKYIIHEFGEYNDDYFAHFMDLIDYYSLDKFYRQHYNEDISIAFVYHLAYHEGRIWGDSPDENYDFAKNYIKLIGE